MKKFDKTVYDAEYHKTSLVQMNLKFNKVHDADVIAQLEKQPNKQAYIRTLILEDIQRQQH